MSTHLTVQIGKLGQVMVSIGKAWGEKMLDTLVLKKNVGTQHML